jgi:hypothetical protein
VDAEQPYMPRASSESSCACPAVYVLRMSWGVWRVAVGLAGTVWQIIAGLIVSLRWGWVLVARRCWQHRIASNFLGAYYSVCACGFFLGFSAGPTQRLLQC